MTDDLIKRLRELANAKTLHSASVATIVSALREAADVLEAERLKRQQAEHERDCILEDLAASVKLRLEAAEKATYCPRCHKAMCP